MDKNDIPERERQVPSHLSPEEEAGTPLGGETVDDILRDILREDGTFDDRFNEMYARYLGGSADELRVGDLSDRTDDLPPASRRVEYQEPEARPAAREPDAAARVSAKLPPDVREIYAREAYGSAKPEFTRDGTVRYPAMGVGESEERVVYDADWEERAKRDAARREKARREQMLRGDSAYVRDFRFSSSDERYNRPNVNPSYIDPLDDSQDVPLFTSRRVSAAQQQRTPQTEVSQAETEERKPFFPAGFPESQEKNETVGGKTEQAMTDDTQTPENGADISMRGVEPREEQPRSADAAVLAAFAGGNEQETEFRERWSGVVEEAAARRDLKAAEETRRQTVRRAQEQQAARARRVAAAEQLQAEEGIPLDLEQKNPKNDFEEIPARIEPDADLYPAAERLDRAAGPREHAADVKRSVDRGEIRKKKAKGDRLKRFAEDNIPRSGDDAKEIARKVIRLVSLVALICALAYLALYGFRYLQYRRQISDFETDIQALEEIEERGGEAVKDTWRSIRAQYPDVDFPEGMQIKFARIYAQNPDFVGWLRIPNIDISTPLVQTTNNSYYLRNNFYGQQSRYGNPFVSYDCTFGREIGQNTIVYGHNLHDGSLFHELTNYMTAEGYLKAPIVTVDTLYETTQWKIFAVILTNSTADMDNGNVFKYLYPSFSTQSAFLSKVEQILARSMIHTGVDVRENDRILTLYTCYQNYFSGGRLVVFARQLRAGESAEIDASQVYYDSSAIFPAGYYTRGRTQPETQATTAAPQTTAAARTETTADVPAETTAGEASLTAPAETAAEETAAGEPAAETIDEGQATTALT